MVSLIIQVRVGESKMAGTLETTQTLEQLYTFDSVDEVRSFLSTNPFLVPLLYEAYSYIRRYFPDAQLLLEVIADTEVADWVTLFLHIISSQPEKALDKLHEFEQDYWLDNLDRSQNKLSFSVGYR